MFDGRSVGVRYHDGVDTDTRFVVVVYVVEEVGVEGPEVSERRVDEDSVDVVVGVLHVQALE